MSVLIQRFASAGSTAGAAVTTRMGLLATTARPFHSHAIRSQSAAAMIGPASNSKWYQWGGGRDLKYAISGGVTGIGGLTKSEDKYFSRTPIPFPHNSSEHKPLSIQQIAFGVFHTAILTTDGHVYMMGANNKRHCLGFGDKLKSTEILREPARLDGLPPIQQMALGMNHSIALARDGTVWTWGWGGNTMTESALGHGGWGDCPTPKQITINGFDKIKIVQIAAGHQHSMALDADGKLYAFGLGDFGRLGTGDSGSEKAPVQIKSLSNVKIRKIVCGPNFNAAITDKNLLYTWGKNDAGQLGAGGGLLSVDMLNMESLPVLVEHLHFHENQTVIDVAAGDKHMLCVTAKQQIYHWGNHKTPAPQLMTGQIQRFRIASVAAGAGFSACTDVLGHVYTWGAQNSCCLGHADSAQLINRFSYVKEPKRVPGFGLAGSTPFGPAVSITGGYRKIAVQTGELPRPPPISSAAAAAPAKK